MIIATSEILAHAMQVLGSELTPAQSTVLEGYCAAARVQCQTRFREDVPEENLPVVLQACGMLAAAMFLESEAEAEVSSFSAGKLSVTTKTNVDGRAQRLKNMALELLAPFSYGTFAFLGVRG